MDNSYQNSIVFQYILAVKIKTPPYFTAPRKNAPGHGPRYFIDFSEGILPKASGTSEEHGRLLGHKKLLVILKHILVTIIENFGSSNGKPDILDDSYQNSTVFSVYLTLQN